MQDLRLSQNLLELQPSLQKQRSKNYFLEPKLQWTLAKLVIWFSLETGTGKNDRIYL